MVARTPSITDVEDLVTYTSVRAEVTMSTNDTVTLSDFTSSANISSVHAVKSADLTEVTMTIANNVLTLTTAALTNIPLVIYAVGTKAT